MQPTVRPRSQSGRRGISVVILACLVLFAGCGGDSTGGGADTTTSTTAVPTGDDQAVVAIGLEPVDGFFTEGFEVGLRFETAGGRVIATALWSEFIRSTDDEPSLEAYYRSVLEQPVPAGQVVVLASANVGIGPGPETPDVTGDLRCRIELTVEPGDRAEVEVSFVEDDCLHLVE